MSIGIALGMQLGRTDGGSGGGASYWLDSSYDRRIVVDATNVQSIALHDHLIDITVPAAANIDADSLRAVELTSLDTVDRAYDWRYALGTASPNKLPFLPVSISGTTVTLKTLGKWAASETRSFALYWDSTSAVAALNYTYLDGIVRTWSFVVTAGDTGNTFTVNMGGATYTYIQAGGDSATTIAQAIKTAMNLGAVAVGSGAAATITVTQTNKLDGTFAVTSTGSIFTGTGAIAITQPAHFGVGRIGPDTDVFNATAFVFGFPQHTGTGQQTKPGWGRATQANQIVRSMSYTINGTGTINATGATTDTLVNDGPRMRATGTITFARSEWTGVWSATYSQHIYTGRKSDDTGTDSLNKMVDVVKVTLTYTNQTGYTSTAIAGNVTTAQQFSFFGHVNSDNVFTANVTVSAANDIKFFHAPLSTGTIVEDASGADLSGVTVLDMVMGTTGNITGTGVVVTAAATAGFGSQTPEIKWAASTDIEQRLQLRNLTAASQIPAAATMTVTFWYINAVTGNATTVGDFLIADEVVAFLQSLTGTAPTVVVGTVESYSPVLTPTMDLAGSRTVEAIDWFQDNAVAKTTIAGNGGYDWNVQTSTVSMTDDEDSNYGEAYKLAGLCLRYLRTHDAALIAPIELQVQYHIDIEAAAVAAYGSYWSGSSPYFYWPSSVASTGYTADGGVVGTTGDNFDNGAGFGDAFGTINYTQGQVRRHTSIDQMHMVALGLYHYRYLLRNESAITANTTLWTNAASLISRMKTFEAAHWTAASTARTCHNLDATINGTAHVTTGQLTDATVTTPYNGAEFGLWQVSDGDAITVSPSSNITMDTFMGGVTASASTVAATKRYMQGRTKDMLASDFGRHDVTAGTATWNTSATVYTYPGGWLPRAAGGTTYEFDAARSGDDHWLHVASGYRDSLNGRAGQRMAVIALAALLDPTYVVPIELTGGSTVVREVPITTALDAMAATLATYLPEPTTKAARYAVVGKMGQTSSFDPQRVDSAYTGYWMYAIELWYLVHSGASYTSYYPIGTW